MSSTSHNQKENLTMLLFCCLVAAGLFITIVAGVNTVSNSPVEDRHPLTVERVAPSVLCAKMVTETATVLSCWKE